jgi:hypothetical protein
MSEENSNSIKLGQLIEELKRLQIEYGDIPVFVDGYLGEIPAWPSIEKIKLKENKLGVYFRGKL